MFTFAVVGRDESERLATAIGQARAAAHDADEIWFVDSGSVDGSPELAASLGARVVEAPSGKGRAIARALREVTTEYVVLLDADIDRPTPNIPLALRKVVERTGADLVVAEFDEPKMQLRHTTRYVWGPLVARLFPEAHQRFGCTPLSGFRALRAGQDLGRIPPGFAVEAHINLAVAAAGGAVELAEVGAYWGPVRPKTRLGSEVGAAVLDHAERLGRLDSEMRPRWDRWVEAIVLIVVEGPPAAGDAASPSNLAEPGYVARLEAAVSRPLPPARAAA